MKTNFRALCIELLDELDFQTSHHEIIDLKARARAALAEPEGPPKNCWLDDEPDLCPSRCVFDDPSERIENCTYASVLSARGKSKEECKYYRAALAEGDGVGPTDEELLSLAAKCLGYSSISYGDQHLDTDGPELIAFARAVLARYGTTHPRPIPATQKEQ